MSQPIGTNVVTKIPQFSDDASIEEALKVYHYGIDNYTSQPIVNNVGIEGTIKKIKEDIAANSSAVSALGTTYIRQISASVTPNVISPQTTTTVPLTIKGTGVQTGNLQQWQNSSETNLAVIFSDGSSSFSGYIAAGTNFRSTTTAADIRIINASHKGITVRAFSSQTGNLQEWQNSSGTAMSWVSENGTLYSKGDQVSTIAESFFLMGS